MTVLLEISIYTYMDSCMLRGRGWAVRSIAEVGLLQVVADVGRRAVRAVQGLLEGQRYARALQSPSGYA